MRKSFKIILGILLVAIVTMPFMNVNAAEVPTLSMNVNGDFYVGKQQEFSITTNVPEDYKNIMVLGEGSISDTSAIEKLEYYEVKDGKWYEMPADSLFGPAGTGFPLTDGATSKFRVTFNKAGDYTVNIALKDATTQNVVAQNSLNIKVIDGSIKNVTNEAELLDALNNQEVKTINILNNITTTAKVNVTRDVTINGNSNTITLNLADKTTWGGHYVLQAYRANVTINDLSLTGGNAGLLVNGANVTVNGTMNVSGNGFGGIEVSGPNPSINLTNATLVNSSEDYGLPTLWTDPVLENVVVGYAFEAKVEGTNGTNEQLHFYLVEENSIPKADDQIKENIDKDTIIVYTTSDDYVSVEVLNMLKNGPEKIVVLATEKVVIGFNTKNMVNEFTENLKLNVTVTTENILGDKVKLGENAKALFVSLDYKGVLPKDTVIMFDVNGLYNAGDKVHLYYFNEQTQKVELLSDINIDEDGLATIITDYAYTYVLSSEEIVTTPVETPDNTNNNQENNTNTENIEEIVNPNTSDFTIVMIAIFAFMATAGFAYVAKTKMLHNNI